MSLLFSLVITFTFAAGASAAPRGKKKAAPAKAAKIAKNTRAPKGRQQQAAAKKPSRKETRAERRERARDERASSAKGRK
ncbi:MAG: hypothetical protein LC800_09600, partial [Acidobacteria bacterium]|nr:hypothetical protein [Acidobacteriota bacterium]